MRTTVEWDPGRPVELEYIRDLGGSRAALYDKTVKPRRHIDTVRIKQATALANGLIELEIDYDGPIPEKLRVELVG